MSWNWLRMFAKRIIPASWRARFRLFRSIGPRLEALERRLEWAENNALFVIRQLCQSNGSQPYPSIPQKERVRSHEFRVHSQNGEDGILQYIFSVIGFNSRRFVEIGVQNGSECNTAFLALDCGWSGLLVDGNADDIAEGQRCYRSHLGISADRVRLVCQFVTRENVNQIIEEQEISGEIDLFSLDIDGNDFWVWKSLEVIRPRVVVVEFNASLGTEMSCTVEYDPSFDRFKKHPTGYYHGASLRALAVMGATKGYSLVGCSSCGSNAFFVQTECCQGAIREISVEEAYYPLRTCFRLGTPDQQFAAIAGLRFVEV
jgi:hypothetical protein